MGVLAAAHDAGVLLVIAVVGTQAGVRALQQVAFTACAAHVVQQDGQRVTLAELGTLGGPHGVREAQLAAHDGSALGVPGVIAHGAPASAREHLHAPAAWTQARGPDRKSTRLNSSH